MNMISLSSGGAVWNEFALQPAGLWVECGLIEIGRAVEHARVADEIVERFPFLVLGGTAMASGSAERRNHCGSDDANALELSANTARDFAHRLLHRSEEHTSELQSHSF